MRRYPGARVDTGSSGQEKAVHAGRPLVVAGMDETRLGALKKASCYSGGTKHGHLTSEELQPEDSGQDRLKPGH